MPPGWIHLLSTKVSEENYINTKGQAGLSRQWQHLGRKSEAREGGMARWRVAAAANQKTLSGGKATRPELTCRFSGGEKYKSKGGRVMMKRRRRGWVLTRHAFHRTWAVLALPLRHIRPPDGDERSTAWLEFNILQRIHNFDLFVLFIYVYILHILHYNNKIICFAQQTLLFFHKHRSGCYSTQCMRLRSPGLYVQATVVRWQALDREWA